MSLFDASKLSSFEIPADLITIANKGVDNLRDRLVDEIDTSCFLPGYLIRWSVQMFFQGHVRRSLMFIEGGYDAFLSGRGLVAYACARAIYETFACVFDFCDKVTEHIQRRNFEKAGAFRPPDDDGNLVNKALDILEAPWPRREEILLRDWLHDEATTGVDKARMLVNRILDTGLEPFNQPQLLPPIEPGDIELVCWMGLSQVS
jgi:hypothetical protein